jgi:hypothetical protein
MARGRVAPQVSSPAPARAGLLQRRCDCGAAPGKGGKCEECRDKELGLQRRAAVPAGPGLAPPIVQEVLRSPGQPLDPASRAFLEPRFGHDFSGVRVHTDARAAESARSVQARAYTVGEHVVFQAGEYDPRSVEGRRLIAHELTHVLQQRPGTHQVGDGEGPPVRVSRVGQPLLSRQGTITRCRELGVPCPAPLATHGTICRLADCVPSVTARLPFAVSPGVCIYACVDGRTCACVLVGSSTSAVCTFTICTSPGQAVSEADTRDLADRALALAAEQSGGAPAAPEGTSEEAPTAQAKLAIKAPDDPYEREADRIAERVLQAPAPARPRPGHRLADVGRAAAAPVGAPAGSLLQRQAGGAAACPTAVTFNSAQPVHVPACGAAMRASANAGPVAWSLQAGTAAVDPGSTIAANGTITLAATQAAGDITARATATAAAAGGCFVDQPLQIRSQPTGIASTSVVSAAGGTDYGATFDHVFISADGNVASLENVGVGERFTNVPNPAAATHALTAPLYPFGGTFTLTTSTLTPNATNNWFLTASGGLGGTMDSVTIGQAGINVGRFIQSASNPAPPQGLPAGFTLLQSLNWFCPQSPAANRWTPFVTVAHTRTLRNMGGSLKFATTVNGVEQADDYVGPTGVLNLAATPANTPRSPAPPPGGAPGGGGAPAPPPANTVQLHVDTLPDSLPAGQALNWSLVGAALGCSVAADPTDDHAAILTIGRTAGTVTVQAADSTNTNRARVAVVIT